MTKATRLDEAIYDEVQRLARDYFEAPLVSRFELAAGSARPARRHCELRTGLRPTRLDETDFAGASGLALLLGLPARGRSLSDAVELARELDPERFDDLVLGMERRRS
jgi:hypothetical protein